jgi:N-hydroxyarylamine O-acetyltransferase
MAELTGFERTKLLLNHKKPDRIGLYEHFWGDTHREWLQKGSIPEGTDFNRHFNFDIAMGGGLNLAGNMDFVPEVIAEDEDTITTKNQNYAIFRTHKKHDTTPEHVGFTVDCRERWEELIKPNIFADVKRIGFEGEARADYKTLYELQYRHFLSVPYENLDILRNVPLSLDCGDLYKKIVVNGRGGYCFELNALFNWLLCEIGFKTVSYFARFLLDEPDISLVMRRHRIMRVEIDGEYYITDVGVGSIVPERPLKLVENLETGIRGITYRFNKEPFLGWVLSFFRKGEWTQLYSFTEEEQQEIDFVQPDFYCQYHPDSIFNKKNMLAIRTETGKNSIDGNTFKMFELSNGETTDKECTDAEIAGILKEYFGITGRK